MKRFSLMAICVLFCAVSIGTAQAGLLFVPNTYGLSARSVALGNAMTAVGDDYSMTYFNPAALGRLSSNQIDLGYLYAAPDFQGGPKSGEDVDFDTANKITLIGFTMDLSQLFESEHGLGLGLDIAIDNNLKSFMTFEDKRSDNGQFLRYGVTSVTMITGLGLEICEKIAIGGGGYVMVKGTNKLIAETDMAGNTREEEIQVSAEPVIAPIASIYATVLENLTLGLAYRGKGVAEFSEIEAATDAQVSDSSLTELNLMMAFKDTYVPQQVSFGAAIYPTDALLVALDLTWANWADYADEVTEADSVKDDAEFDTKDTFIPRLGVEYALTDNLSAAAGYYYEQTPFEDPGIGNNVVLDNDKHALSVGVSHDFDYLSMFKLPPAFGATYFYHYLAPRTVEAGDGAEYESSGQLHGVVANFTLKF
jgi:long-chain fatty acid transport protein